MRDTRTTADDLYEKISAVSAENRQLKFRLKRVWEKAVEGQAKAENGGGVLAWRDALSEIEEVSK